MSFSQPPEHFRVTEMRKSLLPGKISIAAGCHRAHRFNKVTQAEPFEGIHLEALSAFVCLHCCL